MKKFITAALTVAAMFVVSPSAAPADYVVIGGQVHCNDQQWQQMGQTYTVGPNPTWAYVQFAWLLPAPNKDITVRMVSPYPVLNPEFARIHWTPWADTRQQYFNYGPIWYGFSFRIQCRLKNGEGTTANTHQAVIQF